MEDLKNQIRKNNVIIGKVKSIIDYISYFQKTALILFVCSTLIRTILDMISAT